MISWMQKHNKYLVWTIWIATIAFIGAGFVGWGSYNMGSKAGSIAKVGEISITQQKFNMVYSNLYAQYNQMFQGKFDKEKAKQMGLEQQAFARLESQAKLLNFAKEVGIIANDAEVLTEIQKTKAFQKDGNFNQEIYDTYLKSQRLKPKDLEERIQEQLIISKTLVLLDTNTSTKLEFNTIAAAQNIADKISYKVVTSEDINYTTDASKVKTLWETQKENYMTQEQFALSLVWTTSQDVNVSDTELKAFYQKNSFNYTDAKGKQLSFEEAKAKASAALKLQKSKKNAQLAYIAFKKGQHKEIEKTTLAYGDRKLSSTLWKEIKSKKIGDIIKPKVIGNQYVSVKIDSITKPKVKSFDEAKKDVTVVYDRQAKKEALSKHATSLLESLGDKKTTTTNFLTISSKEALNPLNSQESLQFLQKLFTSRKEKGIISVTNKVVAYNIIEQKFLSTDVNQTKSVKDTVRLMKNNMLQENLIKMLDDKYPTEVYVKGLKN